MGDLTISRESVIRHYKAADDITKKTLEAIFGKDLFVPKDVTERIKSYEDACRELGIKPINTMVRTFSNQAGEVILDDNTIAFMKLRTIVEALNEGWKPKFTEDEWRYFPLFRLYKQEELDNMQDSEKKERQMIVTDDYQTEYAGFGSALSAYSPSAARAHGGFRLCLRTGNLAIYCGRQFIKLWADYILVRK